MLEILIFLTWTLFVVYATWFLTKARHVAPLSVDEARILWRIHKKDSECKARRWRKIRRRSRVVGFECGCGYKHVQKRPVVARSPTAQIEAGAYVPSTMGRRER